MIYRMLGEGSEAGERCRHEVGWRRVRELCGGDVAAERPWGRGIPGDTLSDLIKDPPCIVLGVGGSSY